jgi:hypothetical protein
MARLAHHEGMMIDVASGGELYVVLRSGVPAEHLVLHGSNKSTKELALALSVGIGRIVVDSFDEIERLNRLVARTSTARPRALVRVNPGVDANTHASIATGREDSKFGFSLASGAAAEAVDLLSSCHSPVDLVGLHTHIGSQIFELSAFSCAIDLLAPLVMKTQLASCVSAAAWESPIRVTRRHRCQSPNGLPWCVMLAAGPASPTRSGSQLSRGVPSRRRPRSPAIGSVPSRLSPCLRWIVSAPTSASTAG